MQAKATSILRTTKLKVQSLSWLGVEGRPKGEGDVRERAQPALAATLELDSQKWGLCL